MVKIGFDSKFKIRSINPKLTAAGLTEKEKRLQDLQIILQMKKKMHQESIQER